MSRTGRDGLRRACLFVSVFGNLALLGFFKYRNFAIESMSAGLEAAGLEGWAPLWPELTLPVGISFYTFQSMSYTIDVYRGEAPAVPWRRGLDFLCYVSMFPQLVAGPIVRFKEIREQLVSRTHTLEKFSRGVVYFMLGFAKKTLIANNVGVLAEALFQTAEPGFQDSWIGLLAYAFQIYFDFSGYSDMAIGLGLMIGFVLPINFDAPYRSRSITEFWRRWHISLSTWLRDYLYVPLGGNRRGKTRTYVNLWLTMLLGGIWHGAAWTFVLWGAWHGSLLAIERMAGKRSWYHGLPGPLQTTITMILVMIGWVLFRSESLAQIGDILGGLGGLHGFGELSLRGHYSIRMPMLALVVAFVIVWRGTTTQAWTKRIGVKKVLLVWLLFILGVQQMLQTGFNPFLYFQF